MTFLPTVALASPAAAEGADRCGSALLGVGGELVWGASTVNVDAFRKGWLGGQGEALEGAKAKARAEATAQLRRQVCDGLVDARDCDAEMALAMPVVERLYEGERWACAVTGIERARLGTNTATGRATRSLVALGDALREELLLKGVRASVYLDLVRSPQGCSAVGLEGARQVVEGALGAGGIAVLRDGATAGATWCVELEATMRGAETQIQARIVDPAVGGATGLRPVTFPASAFDLTSLPAGCPAPVKPRPGTGGLVARLSAPATVCSGQTFTPTLSLSAPARVQVWAVSPDGSATLLEPGSSGTGTRADGAWDLPLPELRAQPSGMAGDDILVAVAMPSSATVTSSAPQAFCHVPRFDASRIPAGAAVAVQTLHVLDDEGRCPLAEDVRFRMASGAERASTQPLCP